MVTKFTDAYTTGIPAWLYDSIHYKVWDEIAYPFTNFNDAVVISPFTLLSVWLVIHAGIKVNSV